MSTYTIEYETAIDSVADGDLIRAYDLSGKDYNSISMQTLRAAMTGAVVDTTATSLTITAASHAGKLVTISSAAPVTITLPQATGTGNIYRFAFLVAATGTASKIQVANATDVMTGYVFAVTTTSDNAEAFKTSATSDTASFNGTTQGGVVGDQFEVIDAATGKFVVRGFTAPTGTEATNFSAAVS